MNKTGAMKERCEKEPITTTKKKQKKKAEVFLLAKINKRKATDMSGHVIFFQP